MNLKELLADDRARWRRHLGADAETIRALAAALPSLPTDYLEFLGLSNGGEGDLGLALGWFQLWRAEDVASQNAGYSVPEFLPGFVAFGSSGGGEMLAFDVSGAVYAVPFIPMSRDDAQLLAPRFLDLVRAFGHVSPAV